MVTGTAANSHRRRFRNEVRSGNLGPTHLRWGRGKLKRTSLFAEAPPAPLNFTATAVAGGVQLNWDRMPNVQYFWITKSDDGVNNWTNVSPTIPGSNTAYLHSFAPATLRYFRIRALYPGAAQNGTLSSVISATSL